MPAIKGAHRWIPLPLLEFQSSEFGKLLIIVALGAFAVDRSRRLHERRTTARIMLLALHLAVRPFGVAWAFVTALLVTAGWSLALLLRRRRTI